MNIPTKLLHFMLKQFNAKKITTKIILKPARSNGFKYPNRLRRKFSTDHFQVKNRDVVTFQPRNESVGGHIFFLHGGAYSVEAQSGHWWFVEHMVQKSSFKLSFIDYPLTPEYNYKESHEMVLQAFTKLVEFYPKDSFYFVGDSAGGGFCLSFAQSLRNKNFIKMPVNLSSINKKELID